MQDRATDKLLAVGEHVCLACSGKAAGACVRAWVG